MYGQSEEAGFNNQKQSLVFDRLCYMPSIASETQRGHVQLLPAGNWDTEEQRTCIRAFLFHFSVIKRQLKYQQEQYDLKI